MRANEDADTASVRRRRGEINDQLYRELKANGVQCQMIRYPRSWHSLWSPKFVKDAFTRNLE
jgi:hypothetical protein